MQVTVSSRSSSEESLPDSLSNLKSYDWEPRRSVSEVAELMKKLPLSSDTEDKYIIYIYCFSDHCPIDTNNTSSSSNLLINLVL